MDLVGDFGIFLTKRSERVQFINIWVESEAGEHN